jgi:hypothetical protein
MENLKVSDQPQIILKRLIRVNKIMMAQPNVRSRPNLKQQLEEQQALLEMLEPYLDA